jgi:hypothetical protein
MWVKMVSSYCLDETLAQQFGLDARKKGRFRLRFLRKLADRGVRCRLLAARGAAISRREL